MYSIHYFRVSFLVEPSYTCCPSGCVQFVVLPQKLCWAYYRHLAITYIRLWLMVNFYLLPFCHIEVGRGYYLHTDPVIFRGCNIIEKFSFNGSILCWYVTYPDLETYENCSIALLILTAHTSKKLIRFPSSSVWIINVWVSYVWITYVLSVSETRNQKVTWHKDELTLTNF